MKRPWVRGLGTGPRTSIILLQHQYAVRYDNIGRWYGVPVWYGMPH